MSNFRISTTHLIEKFNEFNGLYFRNKIPMVRFDFMVSNRTLGLYNRANHLIKISTFYDMPELVYDSVLLHEMVHAYLHVTNQTDVGRNYHHGKNFKRECDRINALTNNKYQLQRTCSFVKHKKQRIAKNFVIFITKDKNNERAIGKVSSKNWKLFSDNLIGRYFEEIEVYKPKEGFIFENFTTSYTRFHYYMIDDVDTLIKTKLGTKVTTTVTLSTKR